MSSTILYCDLGFSTKKSRAKCRLSTGGFIVTLPFVEFNPVSVTIFQCLIDFIKTPLGSSNNK